MRLLRGAGACLLAASLVLTGCGNDSNDPTPFDPAAMSGDFDAAGSAFSDIFNGDVGTSFALAGEAMSTMTGGGPVLIKAPLALMASDARLAPRPDSAIASIRALLGSRGTVAGSAVILPSELLGTVYVWDADTDEYVASERTDGPDDGVRFVVYAVDPISHTYAEPLNEVGYVDLRDLSTATVDIARLSVVSQGTTYFDYTVSATETTNGGSVDVMGFVSDGDHRIDFDLRNDFTMTEVSESTSLDWELEFPDLDLTLAYDIDFSSDANGSQGDWAASLRGPHGYVDLTGTTTDDESGWTETFAFEVNGDEFATYSCSNTAEVCDFVSADGDALTAAEIDALEGVVGFAEGGAVIAIYLLYPVGLFFPL